MNSHGALRSRIFSILFLRSGDFELLGGFPFMDVHRVVPCAASAIINDALAGERYDRDEKNDEPEARVVGCQFDRAMAMRAGARPLGYILLAEIARADSVVSDGHKFNSLIAD